MRNLPLLLSLALNAWAQPDRLEDTLYISLNHPAIHYDQPSDDPVARLEQRLESGSIQLDFASNGWGYRLILSYWYFRKPAFSSPASRRAHRGRSTSMTR